MKSVWVFFFSVFFLASCGNDSSSNSHSNTLWKKTYGGSNWDELNSIAITPDGGALLGGYRGAKRPKPIDLDMYVVRVDDEGNTLWEKTYGGAGVEVVETLVSTPDGGALLGGRTEPEGSSKPDMYLVRVDARGNKLWDKTYGRSGWDSIESLVLTADGGALLGGYTKLGSGDEAWLKQKMLTQTISEIMDEASNTDMYLVRVDARGNKLWEKTYDKTKTDILRSLVLTPDGGAFLGGHAELGNGLANYDMYLIRVDEDGNKLWDKTYGGSQRDEIRTLVLTPDGGALLGGSTTSSGAGATDMYLIRVDADGNPQWEKTYGGAKYDSISSLAITPDGGVLIGGTTRSGNAGKTEMYLVRVDEDGNTLWENTYGESKSDNLSSLVITPDGGVLVGGNTSSKGHDMSLLRLEKR